MHVFDVNRVTTESHRSLTSDNYDTKMYSLHIFKCAGIILILFLSLTTADKSVDKNKDDFNNGTAPSPNPEDTTGATSTQEPPVTTANGSPKEECFPSPNTQKINQYIVGYGSLIQAASKDQTRKDKITGESIPVIIQGFSRSWSVQNKNSISVTPTYLGAVEDKFKSLNGVIFKLPPGDTETVLASLDVRQALYCRRHIEAKDIKFLNSDNNTLTPDQNEEYWIYVNRPEFTFVPDRAHPIVQSYVDTFVGGCLDIEEKYGLSGFAGDCIDSTQGWSKYWVNDRIYPRRPASFEPRAARVDTLLAAKVPDAYNAIVIEG